MSESGISFNLAFGRAFTGMTRILFKPFDLERWFAFGLAAWLGGSALQSGGFSGNFPTEFPDTGTGGPNLNVWDAMMEHMPLILAIAIPVVLILVLASLVFLYLKSRFALVFVDQVAHNRAEIRRPWLAYRAGGWSQFTWRAGVFLGFVGVGIGLLLGALLALKPLLSGGRPTPSLFVSLGILVLVLIVLQVAVGVFNTLLDGLATPLMVRYTCTAREALGMVGQLWSWSRGFVVRYVLCEFLFAFFSGVLVLAFSVALCCVGGCVLSIPYLGAVVALPLYVFHRLFSMELLRQMGESYDPFPVIPDLSADPSTPETTFGLPELPPLPPILGG